MALCPEQSKVIAWYSMMMVNLIVIYLGRQLVIFIPYQRLDLRDDLSLLGPWKKVEESIHEWYHINRGHRIEGVFPSSDPVLEYSVTPTFHLLTCVKLPSSRENIYVRSSGHLSHALIHHAMLEALEILFYIVT